MFSVNSITCNHLLWAYSDEQVLCQLQKLSNLTIARKLKPIV